MAITLPTLPSAPTRKNPAMLVLYGGYKVGKSTILGDLKDCFTIVTDPRGHDFITSLRYQVNNMAEFDALLVELVSKTPRPYRRVAIDTLTQIEDWCEAEATRVYKTSPTGVNFTGASVLTLPDGAGYQWLRLVFEKRLAMIEKLAEEVIVICHLRDLKRDDKLKDQATGNVSSTDIDLTGKCKKMVCARYDCIGFLNRRPAPTATDPKATALWASFRTNEQVACGTRSAHLRGQEFIFDWQKIYIENY